MSSYTRANIGNGQFEKLKNRLQYIKPFLKKSGEFTVHDFEMEMDKRPQDIAYLLKQEGAVEVIDREYHVLQENSGPVNVYRWDEEVKEELQRYLNDRDNMPCPEQHRLHIYNDPEVPEDKLGCRYCAEVGKHPQFEKQEIKSQL